MQGIIAEHSAIYDKTLEDHILDGMRNDAIKSQIRSDELNMMYGSGQFRKLRSRRPNDILARMCMLGKLRSRLQTVVKQQNCQLVIYLTGEHFDKTVDAVELEGDAFIDESGQ